LIEIKVTEDYDSMSRIAAQIVKEQLDRKADSVLGLATGSTPIKLYRNLVKLYRKGKINFSKTVTFNLDEYWPMSRRSRYSYHYYMEHYLFKWINIKKQNIYIPSGEISKEKIEEHCEWYEDEIRRHGRIDLQILGIGGGYYDSNGKYYGGHIGFNEPGSDFNSRTRLVRLSEQTRSDNSRFFMRVEEIPYYAITMGIATIMSAKRIMLLANGEHKANSIRETVEGEINRNVPASILQRHRNVIFILDKGAASRLSQNTTPWLYREIDWREEKVKLARRRENLITRALIWTALKNKVKLNHVDSKMLRRSGLKSLSQFNLEEMLEHSWIELTSKIKGLNELPRGKRILIFSPHPDDDVISMGATIKLLKENKNRIRIAYMVTGNIAVRDEDVIEYLRVGVERDKFAELRKIIIERKIPLRRILDYKSRVREVEAEKAVKLLGISRGELDFLKLPFYETGLIIKKPLSRRDLEIVMKTIKKAEADIIFTPGEIADPHGTHGMCIGAIETALKKLGIKTQRWLYKGGWEEYTIYEADAIIPFDEKLMKLKVEAIKKHRSQLNPLFQGLDPRPFWKRTYDRNRRNGEILQRLGLSCKPYAEFFKIV